MKKVLLVACAFAFAGASFAQEKIKDNSSLHFKDLGDWNESSDNNQDLRREYSQGLYYPVGWKSAASPNSSNFTSFVSLVFPDSTVWDIINTSETDPTPRRIGHSANSWGIILDPTDELIQFDPDGLPVYSKHNPYTVDSIFFRYGYVRQVDSFDFGNGLEPIVDTLRVRLYSFNTAGIAPGSLVGGNTFSNVRSYNAGLGYSPVAFRTITIPLTNADSTSRNMTTGGWFSRSRTVAIGEDIPGSSVQANNKLFGFTLHFKPAKPYSQGDTLIDLTDELNINISNKNNYFVTSFFRDDNPQGQQVPSDGHLGNTLVLNKFARYATNANGFLGYVPGNAYFNNQYLNAGFYIHTENLSAESLEAIGAKVGNPYPNPSAQAMVSIPVTTKSNSDVAVSITDITGKTVYNAEYKINGTDNVSFKTAGYAAGIYNVSVTIEGISTTKKLIVK